MSKRKKVMITVNYGYRKSSGFTLVELLVVISIIALLLSILMPSLNKARESAKRVVCASNTRQLYLGVILYAENNDGKMPYHIKVDRTKGQYNPYETYAIHHATQPADDLVQGLGRLYPGYMTNLKSYFCPSMKDPAFAYPKMSKSTPHNFDSQFALLNNQWTGQEPTRMPGRSSYNYRAGDFGNFTPGPLFWTQKVQLDLAKLKGGGKAMITDLWTLSVSKPSTIAHKDGFNVGFTDGHVKWNRVEDYSQISDHFLRVVTYWLWMDKNMF